MSPNKDNVDRQDENQRRESATIQVLGHVGDDQDKTSTMSGERKWAKSANVMESGPFSMVAKFECALNQLCGAFGEISATKHGMNQILDSYNDNYCNQLQSFSVLAYDYLERIDCLQRR